MKYNVIITEIGKRKIAEAITGKTLMLSKFVIGDNKDVTPHESITAVKNIVYEGQIQELDLINNKISITTVIPTANGGFYMGDIGFYDEDNNLIFYGAIPYQYKLSPEEGGFDIIITTNITIGNKVVSVEFDSSTQFATKEYVTNNALLKGKVTCDELIGKSIK